MKKIFSILLVLLVGLTVLTGCSSDGKEGEKQENKPKEVYAIEEKAELDDYSFVINSVRFDEGDEYFAPEEGKTWIVIDATFENKSDESTTVSSMMSFELKDSEGRKKDLNIMADLDGTLDGDVLAGEKLTGEISYEVETEGDLFLYFNNDLFGGTTLKLDNKKALCCNRRQSTQ